MSLNGLLNVRVTITFNFQDPKPSMAAAMQSALLDTSLKEGAKSEEGVAGFHAKGFPVPMDSPCCWPAAQD